MAIQQKVCEVEEIDSSRCRQNAGIWAYQVRLAATVASGMPEVLHHVFILRRAPARRGQSRNQAPYLLDPERRATLLHGLRKVCMHCGWRVSRSPRKSGTLSSPLPAGVGIGQGAMDPICWKQSGMSLRNTAKIGQCLWAVISDAARSLLVSRLSKHPSSCRAPGAQCLRLTVQSCPLPDKPPQPSLSFAMNLLTTAAMVEPRYKAAWRKADQPLTLDQLF